MLPYNDQPQNDFYPRLREEGDAATLMYEPEKIQFIHAPPRGGRHRHPAVPVLGEIIYPRLREEGDLRMAIALQHILFYHASASGATAGLLALR